MKTAIALAFLLVPLAFPAVEARHPCDVPRDVADVVYVWLENDCVGVYVDSPVGTCPGYIYHDDSVVLALCAVGVWL